MDHDWDNSDQEFNSDDEVNISPAEADIEIEEGNVVEEDFEKQNMVKTTPPIMFLYEKANIISKRATQLEKGAKSTMDKEVRDKKITSSYDIANFEFDNGMLPDYSVIRRLPNNNFEIWKHQDFQYFPN